MSRLFPLDANDSVTTVAMYSDDDSESDKESDSKEPVLKTSMRTEQRALRERESMST